MTTFNTWTQESLAEFAEQANSKLIAQAGEIESLKLDVKTALAAYRQQLTRPSADSQS